MVTSDIESSCVHEEPGMLGTTAGAGDAEVHDSLHRIISFLITQMCTSQTAQVRLTDPLGNATVDPGACWGSEVQESWKDNGSSSHSSQPHSHHAPVR